MRRRAFILRLGAAACIAWAGAAGSSSLPLIAGSTCPSCGAPLEPGARFCGKCGHKLDAPAPSEAAPPDRRAAVMQVVAVHDSELTSTYMSLAAESNVRVDSILGSAFAVGPGEFVTDSGLLVGAKEVTLRSMSGQTIPARIVGSDPMIGIALLQASVPDGAVLRLRDEPPRTGESLDALGFPSTLQGREPVVSTGVVSGLHRSAARIHPIEDYFQSDASLPRGLDGGPMVDTEGRVVGMSTARVWGSMVDLGQSGLGLAIPAEWIVRALAYIRSGAPSRAWIGAYSVAADAESRQRYKLPQDVRLLVEQVFPGSPAEAAGIKRGDGLLKVHGQEVSTLPRLQEHLLEMKAGERIDLEVRRGGEVVRVSATLAARPERPRLSGIDALRFFGGLEVAPKENDRLVVAEVASGSDLAHLKIAPGDVLQSVLSKKDWVHGAKDNSRWRSVRTVADLEERLATAYSDLDFCLGLRFRSKGGDKREVLLWEILTPTAAL
jgi:S1-C subfamily serine protease